MKYVNLIWDFDGMLFNTYPRMATAFQQALSLMGHNVPYEEIMRRIKRSVGKAAGAYAEEFALDRQTLADKYQEIEHGMNPTEMTPYEGIKELLEAAASAGCRHYLYTHRDHTAFAALEHHGMKAFFSGVVTADDPFPAKPAPDAILSILEKHGLIRSDSLMLGDRDIDILAGRNAGIAGCLFDPEHFYDAFEHDMRADSVEGLAKLLNL